MNKIFTLLFSSFFLLVTVSYACEIEIRVEASSTKKKIYKPGDEIVLVVAVTHTHRVCKLEISETKFYPDGLKIIAATDWKENSDGSFQRKVKVRVTGNKSGKLTFRAARSCTKEDNEAVIKLECEVKA